MKEYYLFGLLLMIGLVSAGSINPENDLNISYERINDTMHIWNTQDDYYFNISSGIQFTNHYEDYWSKNIFCLGYYFNDEWVRIICADELNNFNKNIITDNETYVNATLWKDFTYEGYNMRLGIRYHLKLNDYSLTIGIYGKNLGENIPYELGFAWKIIDWEIPYDGIGGDFILINNSDYSLNGVYDLTFKNMSYTSYDDFLNKTVIINLPKFQGYDHGNHLRVKWDSNLNYAVKMYGNGNQEDFYIALLINVGLFSSQQEKTTFIKWIDAEWDLSTATYNGSFVNVRPQNAIPRQIFIGNGGTKMYMTGILPDEIYQYTLDTPWDILTATYNSVKIAGEGTFPTGIFFNETGEVMYIIAYTDKVVERWNLGTSWDLSTATYSNNFDLSNQLGYGWGLFVRPDGLKFYVTGAGSSQIVQYSMSTPWDITSASTDNKNFSVSNEGAAPAGIFFNKSGHDMFYMSYLADEVFQYSLETPWDITTASYTEKSKNVNSQASKPHGLSFKDDGTKMYVSCSANDSVIEYNMPSAEPPAPPSDCWAEYSADDIYIPHGCEYYFDSEVYI